MYMYSGILISQTLIFSNLPITLIKNRSLSSVKHCNFTPNFSNSPISRTNLYFPWRFEKSGFYRTCEDFSPQKNCPKFELPNSSCSLRVHVAASAAYQPVFSLSLNLMAHCSLCLTRKLYILSVKKYTLQKKRSKLVTKCTHKNKFYAANQPTHPPEVSLNSLPLPLRA